MGGAVMMKNIFIPLISGIIFGIGLVIAGMTNPAKVMGFLNVFGNWDPSLMFVMGGAIIVSMPAFLLIGVWSWLGAGRLLSRTSYLCTNSSGWKCLYVFYCHVHWNANQKNLLNLIYSLK